MSERARSGSAAGRVGAVLSPRVVVRSAARQRAAALAKAPTTARRLGTWAAAMLRRREVQAILAVALAGSMLVVALLAFNGHVNLLKDALGGQSGSAKGAAGKDTTDLFTKVDALSTDAIYVLGPCVTLAGAVGGILWARGARRGPGIVAGAVAAGVVGAGLKTIVS
jgi:hypothetical protein